MEKAFIHIRGLQSLVAMKGGIDALVKNGTLRRLVLWLVPVLIPILKCVC